MAISAVVVAAFMLCAWLVSLRLRDASVVDVGWGLGIVVVAWTCFAAGDGSGARTWIAVALASAWGLRLSAHLAARKLRGEGEDFRMAELRTRYGERFPLVSLFRVFLFQGMGMWVVSLPLQAAQAPETGLGPLDAVGIAVWAAGMAFEVAADVQLARFRADPASRGRVMDRGVWRWSRHPNYFGELCVWVGLCLVALATGDAWWAVASPLMMAIVLLRISGVAAMEAHMARRPGYAEYVRRTSAFVPLPPRA